MIPSYNRVLLTTDLSHLGGAVPGTRAARLSGAARWVPVADGLDAAHPGRRFAAGRTVRLCRSRSP